MTPARARALWYAPFYVSAALTAVNAVLQLARGNYINAVTAAFLAIVFVMWCGQCRREFHRGWRSGYVEGTWAQHDAAAPAVARITATGSITPEPWDAPTWPPLRRNDDAEKSE